MKEVTVVSDDDVPLARKRKTSTSDAADGGKKKKTEGGASKKTTAALEAEKRKATGIFAKAPPSVSLSFPDIVYLSVLFLYLCTLHVSGRRPQPASRSPPRLLGLLEISKICCIATPPPPSPLLLLSANPPPPRKAPKSRMHQALPPWKWILAPLPNSQLSVSRRRRRALLFKWLKLR